MGRPREVVSGVSLNSLEQTESHPGEGGDEVEVASSVAPHERAGNGSSAENHDFDGVGVFCGETEGCGPFVVKLVDVLVEGTVVEAAVSPVVEEVLKDEEQEDLESHLGPIVLVVTFEYEGQFLSCSYAVYMSIGH